MLSLPRTTLFKTLFVLLPLAAFSASTSAADLRRASPAATTTAAEEAIEDSYIVLLKAPEAPRDGDLTQEEITRYVEETAIDMAARYRFELELIYSYALTGFSISAASETTVQRLMRDLRVDGVERDKWVFLGSIEAPEVPPLPPSWAPPPWIPPGDFLPVDPVVPPPSGVGDVNAADFIYTQYKAPWNLDRIDQRDLPLNGIYQYNTTAANAHVYVLDSGIRATHEEFGDRVLLGANFADDDPGLLGEYGMEDCIGTGTSAASVIGGTTYGVAKEVRLVPVRVVRCLNIGKRSEVIAGINWVASQAEKHKTLPAVVYIGVVARADELNTGLEAVEAEKKAVNALIDLGFSVVTGTGHFEDDACKYTPSNIARVITVSATTEDDVRREGSGYGSCVDVFAPGASIPVAWSTSDTATTSSGATRIAAAHVAGAIALWYAFNPNLKEHHVRALMKTQATPDRLSDIGPGSPNLLLYSRVW